MRWYVYEVSPIDYGWNFPQSLSDVIARFNADCSDDVPKEQGYDLSMLKSFVDDWDSAKMAAASKGWEGDFRHKPVVFWIPIEDRFEYGFVFKQDNNGTTFVVSPVVLPWLGSYR
ncbi:TPA: hypothetical protein OTZ20_002895 [Pseudomonas aeruginosa]|nr:hypothetical protein [Pseudomonas aeruginosa]